MAKLNRLSWAARMTRFPRLSSMGGITSIIDRLFSVGRLAWAGGIE